MMKQMAHAAIVATSVLLAGTAQADFKPLDADPTELNFGIISTESTSNLKAQWLPLLDAMEKQVGMKVNAFFAPDYAGVIEGMRFGKVHLAWFGNKSGMEAVDRAGGEVFVQTTKNDGTDGYYSHIITQANNDKINSLQDLFGSCDQTKNFGIGDPNSTSGFLVPSYYVFALNGVDPKKCFKTVRNANHETNLMAVANGQVDAAANNSEQIARSKMKAPDAAAKIKVIWTSPLIPAIRWSIAAICRRNSKAASRPSSWASAVTVRRNRSRKRRRFSPDSATATVSSWIATTRSFTRSASSPCTRTS